MSTTRLTGFLAIDTARRLGLTLRAEGTPRTPARDLSPDAAYTIAQTSPPSISLEVDDSVLATLPARYDVYRVFAPGSAIESWGLHEPAIDGARVSRVVGPLWLIGQPYLVEDSFDWGAGADVVTYRGYLVLAAGAPEPGRRHLNRENAWARAGEAEFRAAWEAWRLEHGNYPSLRAEEAEFRAQLYGARAARAVRS